ncbi:MAG: DUF7474 family protein, partial [Halolamina sp.]
MPQFDYPCPGCRTTNSLHDAGCRFEGTSWPQIEKAYVDIVGELSVQPREEETLREAVHGEWGPLHVASLEQLQHRQRVREREDGQLELLTAAEYKELVSEPTGEPMRTIYREGSYPGCHDNAVFAMIAWYE